MDRCTENIYSIFRDKLLLLGEHVYSPHTPQPTLPHKQVTWGQLCLDFKFDADIAKADSNKAKADNNNVANKAVVSNVAIEANEAN